LTANFLGDAKEMQMKRPTKRLASRMTAVAAALIVFAACTWAGPPYSVKGIVLKVDKRHRTLVVSCQSIPGYMDAMVMPFSVHQVTELEGIAPGLAIDFKLVADERAAYAEDIQVHDFESLEQDPLGARRLKLLDTIVAPAAQTPLISVGQHVPDFALVDQNRQRVTLAQFSGKIVAITFMYTHCPLPNFCFRLSNNFGRLQKRFAQQMGRDLVLLSVTFDPQHDTPEILAKYGDIWKADPKGWHLLTGAQPDIEKLCHELGMNFWPDEGIMAHSLHTVILDRQGNLVANLEGNEFTADQLGDLVQTVMVHAPVRSHRSASGE
jgi:protein SCO1/2